MIAIIIQNMLVVIMIKGNLLVVIMLIWKSTGGYHNNLEICWQL